MNRHLYVKLPFWFTKSYQSAIPSFYTPSSILTVKVTLRQFYNLINHSSPDGNAVSIAKKAGDTTDVQLFLETARVIQYLDTVIDNNGFR